MTAKAKIFDEYYIDKIWPFIQKKLSMKGLAFLPILEQISALNLCVAFHHHLLLLTLHCCIYKDYIINPSNDVERQAFQYSRIALEHCLSYILQKMMNAMFNPLCILLKTVADKFLVWKTCLVVLDFTCIQCSL